MRRKKKVTVRERASDEKKIQVVLKKIGLSEIPSIDEVVLLHQQASNFSKMDQ